MPNVSTKETVIITATITIFYSNTLISQHFERQSDLLGFKCVCSFPSGSTEGCWTEQVSNQTVLKKNNTYIQNKKETFEMYWTRNKEEGLRDCNPLRGYQGRKRSAKAASHLSD